MAPEDQRGETALSSLVRSFSPEGRLIAQSLLGIRDAATEQQHRQWLDTVRREKSGNIVASAESRSLPQTGPGNPVWDAAVKQVVHEWFHGVSEGAWDSAKHPRGGYPQNPGEFSPAEGAGARSPLARSDAQITNVGFNSPRPKTIADPVHKEAESWHDANKNARERRVDSGNGIAMTLKFEHVLDNYQDRIAIRAQDALHAVAKIDARLKNGTLTPDSSLIRQYFGPLNKKQFEAVKKVCHEVAEGARKNAITVESIKSQPAGAADANAITPTVIGKFPRKRIQLLPRYSTLFQERQTAIFFHELTHIFAGTEDLASFNPDSDTGYVNRDGEPVELRPGDRVKNASTYERMLMDMVERETGGKRNP